MPLLAEMCTKPVDYLKDSCIRYQWLLRGYAPRLASPPTSEHLRCIKSTFINTNMTQISSDTAPLFSLIS
jgi:hypothetical protein